VRAIRRRAAAGESQAALARAFGVEPGTVWRIVHRVTWRDLTEED
jgi:transcriptional regulator with XRE-family HTH domain